MYRKQANLYEWVIDGGTFNESPKLDPKQSQ